MHMSKNNFLLDEMLVSERLVKKLEDMLKDILVDDDESLEIALNILKVYVRDGSSGVKSFISSLLEERIGDKA